MNCTAVVVGGSAGAFEPLRAILGALPADFPAPILLVQHLHASDEGLFAQHLDEVTPLTVLEATDKLAVLPGHVYVAPANYHMLAENRETIALSIDSPVNYSRPAIDVLFESAARVWGDRLLGVLLSGASPDGTAGLQAIKARGGHTLVQDPAGAELPLMPDSAIRAGVADEVLPPQGIAARLLAASRGEMP